MLDQAPTMCYRTRFIDCAKDIRVIDGTITAQVTVPAGSTWFDGHFPGTPILPGIAQLAVVVQILCEVLEKPVSATDVSRVRFKQAILPDESVEVQITPRGDDALDFGFRLLKASELACSGFLKLVEI